MKKKFNFNEAVEIILRHVSENPDLLSEDDVKEYIQKRMEVTDHQFKIVKDKMKIAQYIAPDVHWSIWPRGLEYLSSLDSVKNAMKLQKEDLLFNKCSFFAYLILTLAIIGVTTWQTNISNNALKVSRELATSQIAALAPLEPEINIFLETPRDRNFGASYLAFMRPYEEGNVIKYTRDEERVVLLVKNRGQKESGPVKIDAIEPKWLRLIPLHYSTINGTSSVISQTKIFHEECYDEVGRENICKPSIVPKGKHSLTFEIDCYFCEKRLTNKTFEICVWENSSSECNT